MSITGLLNQISSYTLAKVNKTPSLLDLFQVISSVEEAPKIDNLHGISSEYISLLHEISPDPKQVVGEWTLRDLKVLNDWKADYPEDFDNLKADLYQILIEIRVAPTLDLDKGWHIISYLFTGSSSMESLPFLVDETEDDLKVNIILCGNPLDEDACFRYLEAAQVQEISEALLRVPDEVIRQRFDQHVRTQLITYSWSEESYEDVLNHCCEVRDFYNSAANQNNAMLISIV